MKKARSLRAALSLLLVCVLLGAILPAPRAHAADIEFSGVCGKDGDNLTWTLDDDGLLTVSGVGDMADYSWENPAPWPREDVCELVLEDGVASVGDRAFYDCVCLKSVRLPDSLVSIGAFAFSGCDLSAVSLPAGLTALGDCAFAECELKSVKLPASLAAVGDNPFAGCAKLEKVRVAEGNPALYTKDGVLFSKEDGRLVCFPCRLDVKKYSVPDGTLAIAGYAFAECTRLRSVKLREGLREIGEAAFCYCPALKEVTLPASLTVLGTEAFADCDGLRSFLLTAGIAEIGDNPFARCANLRSLRVQAGNTALAVRDGLLFSTADGRLVCCPVGALRETLTVPDGTLAIGALAFQDCEELRALTLPDGLTAIGAEAFSGCDRLKAVVIPDSVTELGNSAFSCCSRLTKAVLPAGLTEIPLGLFDGCDS